MTIFTAPAVCAGLVAVIDVALTTEIQLLLLPPKVTPVVPVKPVPAIVTVVSPAIGPVAGVMLVKSGPLHN